MTTGASFLSRLNHWIIIQVLFVFAALALVLFYPAPDTADRTDWGGDEDRFNQLSVLVDCLMEHQYRSSGGTLGDSSLQADISELFASADDLIFAGIYIADSSGVYRADLAYQNWGDENRWASSSVIARVDTVLQEIGAILPDRYLVPGIRLSEATVFMYSFVAADGRPNIIVTMPGHESLAGSGSNLRYTFFLLFLGSILVSLLTLNLIARRFRQPLQTLIAGMEETTKGRLGEQVEIGGDSELTQLSEVFNLMSHTLKEKHQQLHKSNTSLEESNARLADTGLFLATLFDRAPYSILTTDPVGKITFFNAQAAKDFGYEPAEVIGTDINKLLANHKMTTVEEGFEVLCARKDNTVFPAYLTSTPIRYHSGDVRASLFIVRDISESKSFQNMMVRLDRYYTRGEMAGDIAHEINNFLAVLGGNVELLPILLKRGDREKIDKKLDLMKNTVDRIARFTDGLMDCNMGEVHFDLVDINQVVENVMAFLKPQNRFDDIEVTTLRSDDIPLGEVDVEQIQQLLVNLLNNAADALAETESSRTISVNLSLAEIDNRPAFQIEVRDNGPGVVEDKVAWLLQKRFTTKRKGHGIGLVTCRRIVDAHFGHISYQYDNGATFSVVLPISHESLEKAAADSVSAALTTDA